MKRLIRHLIPKKKRYKLLLFSVGVLALLCVILIAYLKSSHAHKLIMKTVNEQLPGTIESDTWNLSVSGTALTLDNITIKDPDHTQWLSANRLRLNLAVLPLLRKTIRIENLELQAPNVSVIIARDATSNVVSTFTTPTGTTETTSNNESELAFNIIVDRFRINNGHLDLKTPDLQTHINGLSLSCSDLDLSKQTGTLKLQLASAKAQSNQTSINLEHLDLSTMLKKGESLNIDLDLATNLLDVSCKGGLTGLKETPELDLRLHSQCDLALLSRFLDLKPKLAGTATLDAKGKGVLNNPEVETTLSIASPAIDNTIHGKHLTLNALLKDRVIHIKPFTTDLLSINTRLSGEIDLSSYYADGLLNPPATPNNIAYNLRLKQNPTKLETHTEIKGWSGEISSTTFLEGRGVVPDRMTASLKSEIKVEALKRSSQKCPGLGAKLLLEGGLGNQKFNLKTLRIVSGANTIEGHSEFDLTTHKIDGKLNINLREAAPIASSLGLPNFAGKLAAEIAFSENIKHPNVSANVHAESFAFNFFKLPELNLQTNLNPNGTLSVSEFSVKKGGKKRLQLRGKSELYSPNFQLKDTITSRLSVNAYDLSAADFMVSDQVPAPLRPLLEHTINGELNTQLTYAIKQASTHPDKNGPTLQLPFDRLRLIVDLDQPKVVLDIPSFMQARVTTTSTHSKYQLQLECPQTHLTSLLRSVGINNISAELNGNLNIAGKLPDQVATPLSVYLKRIGGQCRIKTRLKGTMKTPKFHAEADLRNLAYHDKTMALNLDHLNGRIEATPNFIRLHRVRADINQGTIHLNANTQLENYQPVNCSLSLFSNDILLPSEMTGLPAPIRLAEIEAVLNSAFAHTTSATESSAAPPFVPDTSMESIVDLNSHTLSMLLSNGISIDAHIDPSKSAIGFKSQFQATQLTPYLQLAGLNHLKSTLDGFLNVSTEQPVTLSPAIGRLLATTTGQTLITANIGDSITSPAYQLSLMLQDLSTPVPQTEMKLDEFNGSLNLNTSHINIDNIAGKLGGGTVRLNGSASHKAFSLKRGELKLETKNLTIPIAKAGEITFDSNLALSETGDVPTISGNVTLVRGHYNKDIKLNLTEILNNPKRNLPKITQGPPPSEPDSQTPKLNITIDAKDPFIVDNNIIFGHIIPDLAVSGTLSNPGLTGRAEIKKGKVTFKNHTFRIKTGIIDFTDPYVIDPILDITGESEIRKWTINLRISGRRENLQFTLTSEPQESYDDILSLLITGKTREELSSGGDNSAMNMVTEKTSQILSAKVEETTPIDTFQMQYDQTDSKSGSVNLNVGKELSRRISVHYALEMKNRETVHTNSAEYKLLENLLFKTFSSSNGETGAELFFRLEFR